MERIDVAQVLIEHRAKVLIVRNRAHDGRPEGWGLPGGSRDPGETLEETARRETLEETGLVVDIAELLTVGELMGRTHDLFFVFRARIVGGDLAVQAADDDVTEVAWVEPTEADRHMPWYAQGVAGLLAGTQPRYYVDRPE